MIRFRSFRNSDPPALAEIWRSQPPLRGLMQPMTAGLLDDLVLSKPYFDPAGLIVATDDDKPVGFAHAGFGPNANGSGLDCNEGAICLLMILNGAPVHEIARGLIARSETYLRGRGAKSVFGGAVGELAPFYVGLYGVTQAPGILATDAAQKDAFLSAGYQSSRECTVLERDLTSFRPIVDRKMMQLRRQYDVVPRVVVRPKSWWDACHWGQIETVRFDLVEPAAANVTRFVRFWDIEPLASSWGRHAVGLIDVGIDRTECEALLLTHLMGEAMREFVSRGISLAEVQVNREQPELSEACQRLGFHEVDEGLRFSQAD